jgi:hypothetical protein
VAGVNDADFVFVVVQGVEQIIVLDAGQGEDGIDAEGDEGVNDGFATGELSHGEFLL